MDKKTIYIENIPIEDFVNALNTFREAGITHFSVESYIKDGRTVVRLYKHEPAPEIDFNDLQA